MSQRAAGIALIALAAFLYFGAYLCDAVYSIGGRSTSGTSDLRSSAIYSLAGGLAYLAYAEILEYRRKPKKDTRVYT